MTTPARTPPIGVAHCLAEKTKARQRGGVVRASTCDPAGFIGPFAIPMAMAQNTAAAAVPRLNAAVPAAVKSSRICMTRTVPKRITNAPENNPPNMPIR